MQNIAIIPNALRDVGLVETKKIIELFLEKGRTVIMEKRFETESFSGVEFSAFEDMLKKADVAVVLGGDGTILEIAPQTAKYNLPVMGINLGNLGFLAQAEKGEYHIIDILLEGKYTVLECMMLNCSIIKDGRETVSFTALNDIVVSGDGYSKMIKVSAWVNGTCIGLYSADGLITASAVGSTAYSLSAGGAIMYPELDAMILTPVCPHTLTARSTVIKGDDVIEIATESDYRSDVIVMADGRRKYVLSGDERVRITKAENKMRLINADSRNFFDVLREKLSDRTEVFAKEESYD